jgi:hypothetical protein
MVNLIGKGTGFSAGPTTSSGLSSVNNSFNPPTGAIQNLLTQQPYNFDSPNQLDALKAAFGAHPEEFNFFWQEYGKNQNLMKPLWAFLEVACLQAGRPVKFLLSLVNVQSPEIEAIVNGDPMDLNNLGAQAQSGILNATEKAQLVAKLSNKQVEVIFKSSMDRFRAAGQIL